MCLGELEPGEPGTPRNASRTRVPDPVGRERVAEIQRARILAAMAEVATERGAVNATVARVVARSGVSRRTFYNLFVDREDCFLAALSDAVERIATFVVPAYERGESWSEKIRGGLTALLELLDHDPEAGRLAIVEALGGGEQAVRCRARILARVITAVDLGRAELTTGEDPPPLVAEGVVGAVLSVVHTRLLGDEPTCFVDLGEALTSMILLPYLGPRATGLELSRGYPRHKDMPVPVRSDPLRSLDMRLTYRTIRVLVAVGENPKASNRKLADAAGVSDPGQMSKLLARLTSVGLVANAGRDFGRGEPNAWRLTRKGREVERAVRARPLPD